MQDGKSESSFYLFSCVHFFIFVVPEHSRLYFLYNIYGDVTESRSKFRKTLPCIHAHVTNQSSNLLYFCLHYSYYELTKTEEPSVYTLETHEIVDKLESIVSKTLPQSQKGGKWEQESVMDLVLKYEVIILLNLKLMLGVFHFSCQFSRVFCSNTIIFYLFTWMFFSSQVLNRCYEELGLLVPNYQLNQLNTIKDVVNFFTSAKPKDTRTFQSIDINNLPPNLNIGGKVPWKSISS